MEETSSLIFPFSTRLITTALENFEYLWDVKTSMFLLLGLLTVVQVLFRFKQLFKNPSVTGTAATQTLASGTAANQISERATVATQTPAMGDAAEPENLPEPVSVVLIDKKQQKEKSAHLVKGDEAGPPQEQEEGAEPEVIARSLSPGDLRDMRKDFSRHPGEHIITWLLRCWDNGAGSLELDGREAKQLRSLSRERGIDMAFGKQTQVLSLWKRLLSGVRERYPFKEDVVCDPGKWTTLESGIQYLRELAVLEFIYYDPDNEQLPTNPGEVRCTQTMWQTFVQSAPSFYANLLVVPAWEDKEALTVDEVVHRLRYFYS